MDMRFRSPGEVLEVVNLGYRTTWQTGGRQQVLGGEAAER